MACARVMLDITERIDHIAKHVSMDSNQAEVVAEQYQQLLSSFSVLCGVDLDGISRISQHLMDAEVFTSAQLLEFSASLRAASAASRRKKAAVQVA